MNFEISIQQVLPALKIAVLCGLVLDLYLASAWVIFKFDLAIDPSGQEKPWVAIFVPAGWFILLAGMVTVTVVSVFTWPLRRIRR